MDINFSSGKLRKEFNDVKKLVRGHGQRRAVLIRRRLDDLAAAEILEVMRNLPGRCHELTGDHSGQLSIDLDGPFRLLFIPANNPLPTRDDGGLEWSKVTAITILEVKNTHG